jgi:hypothetical protein
MDLSIIIVNWNSKDYLQKCISSIRSTTNGIEYEIIVIDNASFDGCGAMLCQLHPDVQFIQSDHNLGFARANNLGYQQSGGRYLLFLNPDTELIGPAISELCDSLDSLADTGLVGAKLLNGDLTIQTSCVRSRPTVLNRVLDCDLLRRLYPRSFLWGMSVLFDDARGPREVEAISGACMLIKREVFEAVGGFSDDYFMYAEDVDLCYKVNLAGYKVCYIPTAEIIHRVGISSRQVASHFSAVNIRESNLRFFRKFKGYICAEYYRAANLTLGFIRLTVLLLLLPFCLGTRRMNRWSAAAGKWTAIVAWALGSVTLANKGK